MIKEHTPSLSIIFLAYNEEQNIAAAIEDGLSFGNSMLEDFEVIVVDDGSRDRTAEIVRGRAAADDRVRLISHETNSGMGAGMHTGIRAAQKEYLVFNAADGQIPCGEIAKLIPLLKDAQIALSTYDSRRENLSRDFFSKGLRLLMFLTAGMRFEMEGLYLFPTSLAKELESQITANTFFFSFAMIELAVRAGATCGSTQISLKPRLAGQSKVLNIRRILRVAKESAGFGLALRTGKLKSPKLQKKPRCP